MQTLKSTLFNLDWPKSRKDTWVRVHNGNSNDLSNNIETGLAGTHPEIMDGNPVVYTRNFYDINFPFWKKKRSFLINKWEINGKTIFNYSF